MRRERAEAHSSPANCNKLRGSCSPIGELVTQQREAKSGLKVELLQTGHIFKWIMNICQMWGEFLRSFSTLSGKEKSTSIEMATHSSILAWRIPGTGEPGGLPSMGSHRVGHDWSDLAVYTFAFYALSLVQFCIISLSSCLIIF